MAEGKKGRERGLDKVYKEILGLIVYLFVFALLYDEKNLMVFLLFIIHLFYNSETDLVQIQALLGLLTMPTYVLAYRKSTEENCQTLEAVHRKCEKWAN